MDHSTHSYWLASSPSPPAQPPPPLADVDVAVIGGGIAGITTAYLLKQAGRSVGLVEARRLLHGVTGHTTAKLTSQHGLMYAELTRLFGADTARRYGECQQRALQWIREESANLAVDCDLEDKDSYVYTPDPSGLPKVRAEAQAAADVGLPASFVGETDLPFAVAGAVRFTGQAQFHPVRWLRALAARIDGDGSYVAEGVRALNVEVADPCVLTTTAGELRAADVVVATHFPIFDRGFFFARLQPVRDLVVAAVMPAEPLPSGMYISATTRHSVRTAALPATDGRPGERMLIVSGGHYRPGERISVSARRQALVAWAGQHFGVRQIDYGWSAQDNSTIDGLPFVGRYTRGGDRLWVATGFGMWGMTNGTHAGLLLRDLITGVDNPSAVLFEPSRLTPRQSAIRFLRSNASVAKHLVGDRVAAVRAPDPHDLRPGEAVVCTVDGRLTAVRRDEDGKLHALSGRCTHQGCAVAYNDDEQSWDCPCHGSRFALDGSVLNGPATEPLAPREPPPAAVTRDES
jgi:glycine/D-amino acid oxidase-like deaminating enzyme/nitrite reductase/ring-hydroxylating ferredoxin subunit